MKPYDDEAPAPRRPGVVAVARAVGVSPSTVSNAFNRPERLSPELRRRVLRAAAELGYGGPDPAARSLRAGRAGAIGVILGRRLAYSFADGATAQFLKGVSDATDPEQLALVLVPGMPDDDASRTPAVRNAAADGLIVYSLPGDDPLIAAARQRHLPTVIVDSPAIADIPGARGPGRDPDFVGIDDAAAAEAMMRHLLGLGHRRVGVISLPLTAHAPSGPVDRARGTASVPLARLRGCGQVTAVEQVPFHNEQTGRAAAHALLDRDASITALFAFSDPLALGARLAARERGLSVPGDLSIAGFDDTAPESEGLTTVHQPLREKGRLATERLLRLVRDPSLPASSELLPTRLVVRGSTAPP